MSKRAYVEADVYTDDHVEIKGGRAKAEAECTPLHAPRANSFLLL